MLKKTWVKWTVAVGIVVALVAVALLSYIQPGAGEVVAVVNGEEITRDQFHSHLEEVYGSEALETLVMYRLILSEAERREVMPSDKAIEDEINLMKTQFGDAGFQQLLSQYGLSEEGLRYNLLITTSLDKIRFSEIEFTEADLQEYFEENRADFATPEEVRASHILVAQEGQVQEILDKLLKDGEDFGALAQTHSLDTASAEDDGDLGFFARGAMYPAFEEAAFEMEVGDITGPVQTEAGYHIIKVTDRREAREAVFEEVRDQVEQAYQDANAPAREEIISRLQEEADVQIHWQGT
ncbi:MAG: peptidylprolyl isomerase [Bacillota bacterium]